jgi:hypothetical protein
MAPVAWPITYLPPPEAAALAADLSVWSAVLIAVLYAGPPETLTLCSVEKPFRIAESARVQAEDGAARTCRKRFLDKPFFHEPRQRRFRLAHAQAHALLKESPSSYAFQSVSHSAVPDKIAQYLSDHGLVKLSSIRRQWQTSSCFEASELPYSEVRGRA